MYIKSLRIRNTKSNEIVREVFFHLGANFVVDTESSERHNKVGKTTFLKLIDVLMGANNKKLVYTDRETNSETPALRDFIINHRIAAEMTIVQRLEAPYGETHELKVDLFPHGSYFIDDQRVNAKSYRKRLNEIFFGIENDIPTFRNLIHSFIRVSVGGDDNSFLRNLPHASNAVYRGVYNFLFDVSNPELDNQLSKLNTKLKQAQESLRQYKRVNGVEDSEQQRQILVALESELSRVKRQADDIFDSEVYKANRDAIVSARARYAELADRLSEIRYRIERNESTLGGAYEEKKRQVDLDISRRFFDEVCSMIPGVNKTFEEMVDFNSKIVDNKIAYFKSINADLQSEYFALEEERRKLLDDSSQYLSLVTQDRIDEYERLSAELMRIQQDIGKRKEIVGTLERYDRDLAIMRDEIQDYSTGGNKRSAESNDYLSMMTSFNGYFGQLASAINSENPILTYSPDTEKFPVSITEISGTSTGTRKSLIAAFDLAYQQFAIENQIKTPRFIVHDVIENIEGDDLRAIIDSANVIEAQYIVAILKEKLDSSNISEREQSSLRILELSSDDKLFEGKSDSSQGENRQG